MSRELEGYCGQVNRAVTKMFVFAALAADDLSAGQTVGLVMRDGLLRAQGDTGDGAVGVTTGAARAGEDVGIADMSGLVALEPGCVTLAKVPAVAHGGSAASDIKKLEREANGQTMVAAVGPEALAALSRAGITAGYFYGVAGALIEAARAGLNPFVVCAADQVNTLAQHLEDESIGYQVVDFHA